MKIFIVGGTGFLGYYSALECLKRGHQVSSISIPDVKLGEWYPREISMQYGNIFEMSKEDLLMLFKNHDALIYAIGPDDRAKPKGSAYEFFHEFLVEKAAKIISCAREAQIKKVVILNSYFAYFQRIWPNSKLSEHHPYIKCRIEQATRLIEEGQNQMKVCILELPYIFGTMPGRTPLWKDILVDMLVNNKNIFFPAGGTNMISVKHVAEAIVGAVELGIHGERYPIGDENHTWKEMIRMMLEPLNMTNKKIITIPRVLGTIYGRMMRKKEKREGIDGGLNYNYIFSDILTKKFYFNSNISRNVLKFGSGGLKEAIIETIHACYPYIL